MSNRKFRNDKHVPLGALQYVPHTIMKLLENIRSGTIGISNVCASCHSMTKSLLSIMVDTVLYVAPLEAIQLELDLDEGASIVYWFYDPKLLINTPTVNGPSYRYWSLTLPVMANLYHRALCSLTGPTIMPATFFDNKVILHRRGIEHGHSRGTKL